MIGGKTNSSMRPTALGTMLSASTYGATIPTIYGTTRSALLAIWAANLRQGASGKKAKKKGMTTYIENVDFLVGSNPIEGILQTWWNNNGRGTLNVINLMATIHDSVTISDANFYFVIGVTAEVTRTGTFNDFGASGSVAYSGVTEYPLWNYWNQGPDLTNCGFLRWWPYLYGWKPSQGNVVNFPQSGIADFTHHIPYGNGNVHIYYAQLVKSTKFLPPITFNRLTWENQLGNGTEYSNAGLAAQQIIYPEYAGLGSSNVDLGSTGMIPNFRVEVKGSFARYGTGDADFVDMIEDIIKSGQLQTGSQLGIVQRGVNCNNLPGTVQSSMFENLEQTVVNLGYPQPNKVGSVLIHFHRWRYGTSATLPTISDTALDTWTPVTRGWSWGMWYTNTLGVVGGGLNSVLVTNGGLSNGNYDEQAYNFEMDPASDTPISANATGTTTVANQVVTVSITVTKPSYLFLGAEFAQGNITANNPLWNNMLPDLQTLEGVTQPTIMSRYVAAAGTYSWTVTISASGNPYGIGIIAISQSAPSKWPKTLGNILDATTLELLRKQDRANGLFGSLAMNAQKPASDWLKDIYQAANGAPVWSGFKLKSIPRSEVSAYGNGEVYVSPTSTGPVATLSETDLIGDDKTPIVVITRRAQTDSNNVLQIEHVNRSNAYNVSTVSEPEAAAVALYGPRKQSPASLHMIQDPAVARKVLNVEIRRLIYLRNTIKFTMKAKWIFLEAMDLIYINDTKLGLTNYPVRLISVKENSDYELECEAEPFIYGVNAPDALAATTQSGYAPDSNVVPTTLNTPIIFEPTPPLYQNANARELWIGISSPDPNYGGCMAYVSFDGGASYKNLGAILGNATTGVLTTDWPPATDPDTTNDLAVNLSESLGTLATFSVAEEDAFLYPCYVATGTPAINNQSGITYTVVSADNGKILELSSTLAVAVTLPLPSTLPAGFTLLLWYGNGNTPGPVTATFTPPGGTLINGAASFVLPTGGNYFGKLTVSGSNYVVTQQANPDYMTIYGALNGNASGSYELMSYATPVLTTANNYTLKATGVGNHLRRAILGAPPTGGGIDHPIGSRFLFLNHQGTAPSSGSKGSLLSNGPGIGIYVLPLAVLALSSGTLYFKFPMFNIFGGGLQDLSSATAYTYKPGGIVAAVNPAGVGPQIFQVN